VVELGMAQHQLQRFKVVADFPIQCGHHSRVTQETTGDNNTLACHLVLDYNDRLRQCFAIDWDQRDFMLVGLNGVCDPHAETLASTSFASSITYTNQSSNPPPVAKVTATFSEREVDTPHPP
jgi:hypothetical protein